MEQDSKETAPLRGLEDAFSRQRDLYIAFATLEPTKRSVTARDAVADSRISADVLVRTWPAQFCEWNGGRRQHADRALVAQFANVQKGLTQALAIAFGSGLLLTSVGAAYIVLLERQTRARYEDLARSRHDLQQLSARLEDAQETERRSISRELHDEVGQSLGALLVDIGTPYRCHIERRSGGRRAIGLTEGL